MPFVEVYVPVGNPFKRTLDEAIREAGAKLFSSAEHGFVLSEDDFTIVFPNVQRARPMTQDVIIRVQLHHFAWRLQDTDGLAKELAEQITERLWMDHDEWGLTVGVSLLFTEIGWGTAVVDRPST